MFEFREKTNLFLEQEAQRQGVPPSELFRRIIEEVDVRLHKRRLKNLTVYQSHMDKLEQLANKTVPESWRGKRGGNKSYIAEILICEYMERVL